MSESKKTRGYLLENKLAIDKSQYKDGKVPFTAYIVLVNHWCHKIILTIAQIAVVIMLCTVFMNVVLRFCFNSGITWAEEIPRLLVTLFTFLACAIGVRDHMHISVTMVYTRFPKGGKMRKFMDVLSDIATLICGIHGCPFGYRNAYLRNFPSLLRNYVYCTSQTRLSAYDRLADMAAVYSSPYWWLCYDIRLNSLPAWNP